MFGRKTRERLDFLESRGRSRDTCIRNLEKSAKQLTCRHDNVVFTDHSGSPFWIGFAGSVRQPYEKECAVCGKVLESYTTKKEWLRAQYEEERTKRPVEGSNVIDPFTGMDEWTRQLAEDYVVRLKKNVMNEEKAKAILGDNIIMETNALDNRNIHWEPKGKVIFINRASLTPDLLKALAWWMENKGEK